MFVREVLRMYSNAHRVFNRESSQSTIMCGHHIEKESIIQVNTYLINRNIDLWGPEDPNEFIPERHLIKQYPIAYIPFDVCLRNSVELQFYLQINLFLYSA